jgi:phosphoribosylanthranilate isomerase
MSLKTKVIINEITNLSDARYCAGMGVDYIGFRIDPGHSKYVDLANFTDITNWITGINFIGESSIVINKDKIDYNVSQLLIDDISLLSEYEGKPTMWSIDIDQVIEVQQSIIEYSSKISELILSGNEEELTTENKKIITELSNDFDVYLSFGISSETVSHMIQELPIKGIALKGSDEIRPGFKDYDELADILEALEEDY